VLTKTGILKRQRESGPDHDHDHDDNGDDDLPIWTNHALAVLFAAQVKLAESLAMFKRALAGR
jgi:ABC-type Zn2+ transport system substrate-binding protein/surface adhesin